MTSIPITQADTVTIQDRVIADYDDGELRVSPASDSVTMKVGRGGNAMFAEKKQKATASLRLTIKAGSPDDAFLDASQKRYDSDPPSFVFLRCRVKTKSSDHSVSGGVVSSRSGRGAHIIYTLTFSAF